MAAPGKELSDRLAPVSAAALFVWGMLLGLAPLVAVVLTWRHAHGVWATAIAGALAAIAVVALFAVSAGRRL